MAIDDVYSCPNCGNDGVEDDLVYIEVVPKCYQVVDGITRKEKRNILEVDENCQWSVDYDGYDRRYIKCTRCSEIQPIENDIYTVPVGYFDENEEPTEEECKVVHTAYYKGLHNLYAPTRQTISVQDVADYLNNLLSIDKDAMDRLFTKRTLIRDKKGGEFLSGVLGILNGLFGLVKRNGLPYGQLVMHSKNYTNEGMEDIVKFSVFEDDAKVKVKKEPT